MIIIKNNKFYFEISELIEIWPYVKDIRKIKFIDDNKCETNYNNVEKDFLNTRYIHFIKSTYTNNNL